MLQGLHSIKIVPDLSTCSVMAPVHQIILHTLRSSALLLGVICVILSVFKFVFHLISTRFALRRIPGPKYSSLIWGEEWRLYHNIPGTLYTGWHREFGKVVKFSGAFGHQVLSIADPRAISFILSQEAYQFPKPHGVRAWFRALLGEGILWIEGKSAHEKQRRALAPAFSQQSVRDLTPVIYETSTKLAAQWSKQIDSSYTIDVEIEVTNWAGRFALDTVGRAAFSYDFDCLSGHPHPLAEALDGLTNNENSLPSFYMRALFWIFPSILSIGKKGEMIRKTRKELGDIASRMWKDAKIAGDPSDKTLMSLMLKTYAASGQQVNEEDIGAQMRTIISAGYETISATVAWILYELAVNPLIQQQLREEVSGVADPSFDDLNRKLPLLDATVKETLRLHPPIIENHHVAAETMVIPLSNPLPGESDLSFVIPKGTILSIPVNVMQEDPLKWGPDATIFRPDRWLERKKEGSAVRREILAFSEGPRACIGRTFAMTEVKILTIILLRQFSFSCPYEIEPFQSFVIRPRIKGHGPSSLPLLVRKIVP